MSISVHTSISNETFILTLTAEVTPTYFEGPLSVTLSQHKTLPFALKGRGRGSGFNNIPPPLRLSFYIVPWLNSDLYFFFVLFERKKLSLGERLITRVFLSHTDAQMMGVWAGAPALCLLLLQQLALTVTAQGIGKCRVYVYQHM